MNGKTKRVILSIGFFILVLCSSPLFAQEFTIMDSIFLPPRYYVGDPVEMRIVVRSRFADAMTIPPEIPQPSWGRIQDIRILERGLDREVRIRFTAFETGTKTLPPLNLGPLVFEDLSIFVTSLLPSTDIDVRGLRGQVLIPGTQVFIIAAIGLIILLPLLWYLVFRALLRGIKKLYQVYKDGKPFRRMQRQLKTLRNSADSIQGRDFYIALLQEIREYLSRRFAISAFSLTTQELGSVFQKYVPEEADRKTLNELFRHGDLVKFAHQPSTMTSRMAHLEQMERILTEVETQQRNLQQKQQRDEKNRKKKKGDEHVEF